MGQTFCLHISRLVSAKEVKVLPPKIAYHSHMTSAAFDPAEGDISGNKSIFRASLTLYRSLVWKASATTMTTTAWGIHGGRKRRLSAVRHQDDSIAACALSFLSGATVL